MPIHAPSRRGFLFGAVSLLAAPSIVRAASLMPVRVVEPLPWPTLDQAGLQLGDTIYIDGKPYLITAQVSRPAMVTLTGHIVSGSRGP